MDLNSTELESILAGTNDGPDGFSILDQINLSEHLNKVADDEPNTQMTVIGPAFPYQSQPEMPESRPEIYKEKQNDFDDKSNILIISVPKSMQESSTFNSLPNIELDMKTINKIKKISSGHAGAFIEPSNEKVGIVRRPPLQVMHQIAPKLEKIPLENIHQSKRKQRFSLRRDDSIMFFGDSHRIVQHRISPSNDAFNYRIIDDRVFGSSVPEMELNRCPGCEKHFKNLPSHKCKKQLMPDTVTTFKFECSVCQASFAHRVEFFEHTKSHNVLFCANCEMFFTNYEVLKLHLKKCGIAGKSVRKPVKKVVAKSQTEKTVKVKTIKTESTANEEKKTKVEVHQIAEKTIKNDPAIIEQKKRSHRTVKTKIIQAAPKTVPKPKNIENIVPALVKDVYKSVDAEQKILRVKRAAQDGGKPSKKKVKQQAVEKNAEPKKITLKSKSQSVIKREMPERAVNKKQI